MNSWIFNIDNDQNVTVDKNAVNLSPELSKLTNNELLFVILVEDYVKSILRRKPKDERIRTAASMIFKKEDYEISGKIKKAMEAYHGLVYDPKRETVDALLRRISKLNAQLTDPENDSKLSVILSEIDKANDKIDELNKKIDEDEEEEKLKIRGGKQLSKIERWQRNKIKYDELRKSI